MLARVAKGTSRRLAGLEVVDSSFLATKHFFFFCTSSGCVAISVRRTGDSDVGVTTATLRLLRLTCALLTALT